MTIHRMKLGSYVVVVVCLFRVDTVVDVDGCFTWVLPHPSLRQKMNDIIFNDSPI